MAVDAQLIGDSFAIYHGDCIEVMGAIPDASVHLSIYGLYHYSSNERDLSNCDDYGQFFDHYAFVVRELARITMPGRTNGEPWASAAVANQEVRRLIDAYCRADKALEDAARTLVDCLELRDDGRGEGVVFTLELAPKAGAR